MDTAESGIHRGCHNYLIYLLHFIIHVSTHCTSAPFASPLMLGGRAGGICDVFYTYNVQQRSQERCRYPTRRVRWVHHRLNGTGFMGQQSKAKYHGSSLVRPRDGMVVWPRDGMVVWSWDGLCLWVWPRWWCGGVRGGLTVVRHMTPLGGVACDPH
jgi:hypothetical protein